MPKIWRFNIENCDTSEVFENTYIKEYVWEFAWDRGWTGQQGRFSIASDSVRKFYAIVIVHFAQ